MTTLAAPVPTRQQTLSAGQKLYVTEISWNDYEQLGEIFRDRSHMRLTYDSGELEVMTLSNEHEFYKRVLARLVDALLEELEIDFYTAGSMTFKMKELDKGLEPDDCYWIAHEHVMRGRVDYDIYKDPPPDLVVEVEISRSILDRLKILAALKVPEIWRYDGAAVIVLRLNEAGQYVEVDKSPTLPQIPLAELAKFAVPDPAKASSQMMSEFRRWAAQYRKEHS